MTQDERIDRDTVYKSLEWDQAATIFKDWHNNQLRAEGRANIYLDDEAYLTGQIAWALIEAKRERARVTFGEFEISKMDSGSIWIRRDGGEGMEVNPDRFIKLISEFWDAEF